MVTPAGTARRPPPCTRLVGPGMFADDHGSTVHLLDGHGYLGSFRFGADSAAYYSAWYVETTAKREEHDAGGASWRFMHRGPFSVLRWDRRVTYLWEGGVPYELAAASHTRAFICWRRRKCHGQRRIAIITVDVQIGEL